MLLLLLLLMSWEWAERSSDPDGQGSGSGTLMYRVESNKQLSRAEAFLLNGQDEQGVTDPGAHETAKEGCRSKVSYGAARSSFKKKHTDAIFPPDRAGESWWLE